MTNAELALTRAKTAAQSATSWIDLHNAVFGIGGIAQSLFPTVEDRRAFSSTDEFIEILTMIHALDPSRSPVPAPAPPVPPTNQA